MNVPKDEMKNLFIKLSSSSKIQTLKDITPAHLNQDAIIFDDNKGLNEIISNKNSLLFNETERDRAVDITERVKNSKKRVGMIKKQNGLSNLNYLNNKNNYNTVTTTVSSRCPTLPAKHQKKPVFPYTPMKTEKSEKKTHTTRSALSTSSNMIALRVKRNKKMMNHSSMEIGKDYDFEPIDLDKDHSYDKKRIKKRENRTVASSANTSKKRYTTIKKLDDKKIAHNEEYDYNRILIDIKGIFGSNLEYFDEDVLFSNLDEISNKGLIKGLLMLSNQQDKKLKKLNEEMKQTKEKYEKIIEEKEENIDVLVTQIKKMNKMFQEFSLDNDNIIKHCEK